MGAEWKISLEIEMRSVLSASGERPRDARSHRLPPPFPRSGGRAGDGGSSHRPRTPHPIVDTRGTTPVPAPSAAKTRGDDVCPRLIRSGYTGDNARPRLSGCENPVGRCSSAPHPSRIHGGRRLSPLHPKRMERMQPLSPPYRRSRDALSATAPSSPGRNTRLTSRDLPAITRVHDARGVGPQSSKTSRVLARVRAIAFGNARPLARELLKPSARRFAAR